MSLLDMRGGYLYEHRPDIFPEGYLTPVEHELWVLYYQNKNRKAA